MDFRFRRRPFEIVAQHLFTQRVVAGISGDVDGGGLLDQLEAEIQQRKRRAAVLPEHRRGDALADRGQRSRLLEQVVVGVAVGVDETGRQHKAAAVDHGFAGQRFQRAAGGDGAAVDAHGSGLPRGAAAVDDDHVADQLAGEVGGRQGGRLGIAGSQGDRQQSGG
ncbi:MAG: hypothetical protein MUE63_15335 [Xanthomonadales bacterium]|nr:hypothetical protein [Xanthomonadales bacterium]